MTKTVSNSAIERACQFVELAARPLDQAFLDFALSTGRRPDAADRIILELAKLQTPDGGFACGVEPDIRGPAPSAISTSVAFQYLQEIGAEGRMPVVRAGIEYLARTVDRTRWVWPIIDERVNEGPHAPWWNLTDLDARFNHFVFNPTAEILGYLYEYAELVPRDVLAAVETTITSALLPLHTIHDGFDLRCCLRLFHSRRLPVSLHDLLEPRLLSSLREADISNPHLDFLGMVPTPNSFGYEETQAGLTRQVERLIASQADDGGWHPFWTWSDVDAEAWREAEREWTGVITCNAIVGLTRHNLVGG